MLHKLLFFAIVAISCGNLRAETSRVKYSGTADYAVQSGTALYWSGSSAMAESIALKQDAATALALGTGTNQAMPATGGTASALITIQSATLKSGSSAVSYTGTGAFAAAVAASGTGSVIVLNPAVYAVDSQIAIKTGQVIDLNGATISYTGTGALFSASAVDGWSVRNGAITGSGAADGLTAIAAYNSKAWTAENLHISAINNGIALTGSGTPSIHAGGLISNVIVTTSGTGISISARSEYHRITNSTFRNNTLGGYFVGGNHIVTNSQFNDNTAGAYFFAGDNDCHGLITNTQFNHNNQIGIYVSGIVCGEFFNNCYMASGTFGLDSCKGVRWLGGAIDSAQVVVTGTLTGVNVIDGVYMPTAGVTVSGSTNSANLWISGAIDSAGQTSYTAPYVSAGAHTGYAVVSGTQLTFQSITSGTAYWDGTALRLPKGLYRIDATLTVPMATGKYFILQINKNDLTAGNTQALAYTPPVAGDVQCNVTWTGYVAGTDVFYFSTLHNLASNPTLYSGAKYNRIHVTRLH
jgi:hypothetical protein